jgi:hypothetical protein
MTLTATRPEEASRRQHSVQCPAEQAKSVEQLVCSNVVCALFTVPCHGACLVTASTQRHITS